MTKRDENERKDKHTTKQKKETKLFQQLISLTLFPISTHQRVVISIDLKKRKKEKKKNCW